MAVVWGSKRGGFMNEISSRRPGNIMFFLIHWPADQHELSDEVFPSHGHQDVSYGHALAETRHHASFGQILAQLDQQTVEALLAGVTPDFIRVT